MKSNLLKTKNLVALLVVLFSVGTLSAKDVFVKAGATGTGADWSTAANPSYLGGTSIADGDVIHLAAGEYVRSTALTISKYVTILGGYAATSTGTDLTLRDVAANKTVFKQDQTVLTPSRAINLNATTGSYGNKITLDGLYFDGFTGVSQGAAMTITTAQGDIDLKNLTFTNNVTTNTLGGALAMQTAFAYDIIVTLDGCVFENNQAAWTTGNGYGGAFFINNGTTAKTINIKNSTFKNNNAYGRGAVGYFGTNMTVNISDCLFDTNQCTVTTDATSNGGCFYIVGTSGYASTFNVTRSIFLNSLVTGKGSVIWFNNGTGSLLNTLNMTNCSLIGNYASRTTSPRAAIDADNYTAQMQIALNGCVLSNYNNSATTATVPSAKKSSFSDVMSVALTLSSTTSTFTNSILNGTHFGNVRNNTYDAISPDTLYNKHTAYLADSTVALALSGNLKITDKIVYKKTFTAANVGTYIHAQIFDVKAKMNFPMTLIATIPAGFTLTVDGTDYAAGVQTINIAAAATNPVISLKIASGLTRLAIPTAKVYAKNGLITVSNVEIGNKLTAYNAAGQQLFSELLKSNNTVFSAKGFVVVKISSATNYQVLKVISE
ncbi:MAG: hypothetical protein WCG93_12480 [Paludibacter sp.]